MHKTRRDTGSRRQPPHAHTHTHIYNLQWPENQVLRRRHILLRPVSGRRGPRFKPTPNGYDPTAAASTSAALHVRILIRYAPFFLFCENVSIFSHKLSVPFQGCFLSFVSLFLGLLDYCKFEYLSVLHWDSSEVDVLGFSVTQ